MALLDFFLSRKKTTANIAKERLQIIVAERRRGDSEPPYLADMKRDNLQRKPLSNFRINSIGRGLLLSY